MPALYPSTHSINEEEGVPIDPGKQQHARPVSDTGVGQDEVDEGDDDDGEKEEEEEAGGKSSLAITQGFANEDLLGGIFLDASSDNEGEILEINDAANEPGDVFWSDSEAARLAYLRLDEAGEEDEMAMVVVVDQSQTWGFTSAQAQSSSPDNELLMLQRPSTAEPNEVASDERVLPYYTDSETGPDGNLDEAPRNIDEVSIIYYCART